MAKKLELRMFYNRTLIA